MKVMVATAVLTLLILVGWDRPYESQVTAFRTAVFRNVYNQLLTTLRDQQVQNLAKIPTMPVQPTTEPEPEPTPVDTTPVPPAPSNPGGRDGSWMWNKSVLDSPRQTGVDRAGVHTAEPLLQNNPR